jgi:hypothetical protein
VEVPCAKFHEQTVVPPSDERTHSRLMPSDMPTSDSGPYLAATTTASKGVARRVRSLAKEFGLRRAALTLGVSHETVLGVLARWPQRLATIALVGARIGANRSESGPRSSASADEMDAP